jgi:hypothetical protein
LGATSELSFPGGKPGTQFTPPTIATETKPKPADLSAMQAKLNRRSTRMLGVRVAHADEVIKQSGLFAAGA